MQRSLQETCKAVVWSIAGFDPSSGAGITADLQVFAAHGQFGCSAITALTAQSTRGVFAVEPVGEAVLAETLERLGEDLPPRGVKIGMLYCPVQMRVVAGWLARFRNARPADPLVVVLDPVLRSSSGKQLYPDSGLAELHASLLPVVDWVTPNWPELSAVSGEQVASLSQAESAARKLARRHPHLHVVATGGDQERTTDLLLEPDGRTFVAEGEKVQTTSTHGTGCAFSSALLSALVEGSEAREAVSRAKVYVTEALRQAPGLGAGRGPLNLLWPLEKGGSRGSIATLGA